MEVIILTGIQASGKTTFYLERYLRSHLHLSMDTIKSRKREQSIFAACLKSGQSVVIDNTNIDKQSRAKYIEQAKLKKNCKIIGFNFISSLNDAIDRNDKRTQIVPTKAIKEAFADITKQEFNEGFDELYTVEIVKDYFDVNEVIE